MTNKIECLPHLTVTIWTHSIVIVGKKQQMEHKYAFFSTNGWYSPWEMILKIPPPKYVSEPTLISMILVPPNVWAPSGGCWNGPMLQLTETNGAVTACFQIVEWPRYVFIIAATVLGWEREGLWGSWGVLEPFQDTMRKQENVKYKMNQIQLFECTFAEWPRWKQLNPFFRSDVGWFVKNLCIFITRKIRSAFVPGGSWLFVLAGHAPWSFANLSHRWILRYPKNILIRPDDGHRRCYNWMVLCEVFMSIPDQKCSI